MAFRKSRNQDIQLDFGGIGKGFALDKCGSILEDWEIEDFLIHGGTSTALSSGCPDSETVGWPVAVGGSWKGPGVPDIFYLRDRALSGSGTEVKGEHVIDPATARPARGHQAAWVSHTSAAVADALSTAFMVMDTSRVKEYCRQVREVWALLIDFEGECHILNTGVAPAKEYRPEDSE